MYATLGHAVPTGRDWTFEPKYDGMRVIAEAGARRARLITRNGKDKSTQFPEIVLALRELAGRAGRTVVVDGEIIARPMRSRHATTDEASGFQQLQGRMHLRDHDEILRLALEAPTTLMAFDLLRDGRTSLVAQPWTTRRERLEQLFDEAADEDDATLALSECRARGTTMLARARRAGWEGIIAKRTDARYQPGARSDDWRKLKLLFRAEFVVGGFTEPRNARTHLGALLLGAYDADGALQYVGHTGGGFSRQSLAAMHGRLTPLARKTSPFATTPRTNELAHWVAPKVVVEVKFAEWTVDRLLRQPIFLGMRDDKAARDVTIEGMSLQRWGTGEMPTDAA
jgi:bifunctional non-homologous end joining protein LigD